ncbi:WXG100 family type VII secretion target [Streptoalloteichus hindustanus]|uniref:WXG100 family type VII secretion target n=1 Tax=Streptoalloteichus hindustanus TaxID=2017 RepID=UPI000935C335|nr:WXG100 family type VII secretion target [Streptoalloteichus hindustanus]
MFGGLFRIVTDAAKAFAANVAEARKHARADDQYVTAGTHWDGYSHKALFKMVWQNAEPGQVESVADTWRRQGVDIERRAEELRQSLAGLMRYWSGSAADEATNTVLRNASWLSELGATTTQMARPIDDAAGALRAAQQQMPAPPGGFNWASLAGGAAAGMAFGGPIGAGIGAVLGGIGSVFGGRSKKRKLKRWAVQTMQRFESAAVGVDNSTPAFRGPGKGTGGDGGGLGPRQPGDGVGRLPTIPVLPRVPGSPGGTTPSRTGSRGDSGSVSTIPSFASSPDGRWSALTSGYGSGSGFGLDGQKFGLGGSGGGGARPGAGLGTGALPIGGLPLGGFGPAGRDALRTARPGAGAAGMPWATTGAQRRDEEDKEHRRRFPFEDDLFEVDEKTAPPVIGG